MAKLSDVAGVVKKMGVKPFGAKLWNEIQADAVFTWASSLAYSWIFAMFPLVVFLLTLAPYLPGQTKDKALEELGPAVQRSVGGEAGKTIMENIEHVMSKSEGGLLSVGLALALWGASGGMSMTMSAIDKAYEVESERSFVMHRLVAIGITVCVVLMVLVVLALLPVGTAVVAYLERWGKISSVAKVGIDVARYVLAFLVLVCSVGLIYYWGPNIKQKWQTVTPGALLTVVVWILMGFGFSFYVSNFGKFNETYGTLGAAIILLLFFYLAAVVLLIGAEFNSVIDFAVLGVKPGSRDFTGVLAESTQRKDAITPAQTEAEKIEQAKRDEADSGKPPVPVPVGRAQAGWWKWAAVGLAAGWMTRSIGGKKPKPVV